MFWVRCEEALSHSEILLGKGLSYEACGEIMNSLSAIIEDLNEESDLLVALLVVELNVSRL